jgi:OOP family OmpA-OmpF porin
MSAIKKINSTKILLLLIAGLAAHNKLVLADTAEALSEQASKEASVTTMRVNMPDQLKKSQSCSVLDIQLNIKQDEMQKEDKEKLSVVESFMKKYPDTTAVIEGHTDNSGTSDTNIKLSQRWAESAKSHLVNDLHIDSSRLTAVGYGDKRPIADNDTEAGKLLNRRIEAVIVCAPDYDGFKTIPAKITLAMEIEFDPYTSFIKPEYHAELVKVASFMKNNPSVTATIEGHDGKLVGDVELTPELAMAISKSRALTVVNYLVDTLGVNRSRFSTSAFGLSRQVDHTLEGQEENRRVTIVFNHN